MKKALFLSLLLALPLHAQTLRKYGVQTTVKFTLIQPAGVDFATVTCATGGGAADDDVQISKDEAAYADSTNCFTQEGNGDYSVVLSAAEMQAARITVSVIDDATKAWLDKAVHVETYGHTSAAHEFDLDSHPFALSSGHVVAAGAVESANFTPTATQFESASPGVTQTPAGGDVKDNIYNGRVACFTSGNLARGCFTITDSELVVSGRVLFTIANHTPAEVSADNDEFNIQ